MTRLQQLQPNIMYRLVLSKSIFKKAIDLLESTYDIFSFSHGLIALHDALDNFTSTIASFLNIPLKPKSFLMDTLEEIQKYEKTINPSFSLTNKSEIAQLNTIRNNIKHQGIIPNIAHAKGLINPVTLFFQEYSLKYFQLEWMILSLSDLIKSDQVRMRLKDVENLLENNKFKDALNEMAIIKFNVFEEFYLFLRLNPLFGFGSMSEKDKKLRESNNIFPKQISDEFGLGGLFSRTDYLEKGIDWNLMQKFEDLTAEVGFDNNIDRNYILKHGHNWGSPNWTKENAFFCYDFLIDAIIKNQRQNVSFKELPVLDEYTIRALAEIKIYDNNDNLVYTMEKNEKRNGYVVGRVDQKWEIFSKEHRLIMLFKEDDKEDVLGFYKEIDKDKIEFLETRIYTKGEDGKDILFERIVGG